MMESAEKHQNVLLPGYTICKSRCLPLSACGFPLMPKALLTISHAECSTEGCGPKPIGFRSGLRKFVPDRQNLYHKELGFETLNTMRLQPNEPWKIRKNSGFCHEQCCRHLSQILHGRVFVYESNFDFITPAHLTGSSIMPHKKNRMF
jgi:argininosuccinate lyase